MRSHNLGFLSHARQDTVPRRVYEEPPTILGMIDILAILFAGKRLPPSSSGIARPAS
jgi:hypothetical protein